MMQENDQDTDDTYLSDLYSELSQEQPSHIQDEKILSEARKDAEQQTTGAVKGSTGSSPDYSFRKKSSGPFSGNWVVPTSLAAVIVLSATVVVMIEKDRPYSLTSPPENFSTEKTLKEVESKPALKPVPEEIVANQEKRVVKKKMKRKAEPQLHDEEVMALQQAIKPKEELRAKTRMAKTDAEAKKDTAQLQRMIASEADQESREDVASTAATPTDQTGQGNVALAKSTPARKAASEVRPSPAESAPMPASSPPASENEVAEESPVLADALEEAVASTEPAEEVIQPEPSLLAKSGDKDQSKLAEVKQESIGAIASSPAASAEPSVEPSAIKAAPMKRLSSVVSGGLVSENSVKDNCSAMSINSCLTSKECTLELDAAKGSYQCRTAQNECEQQFSQADDTQELCESRSGCKFQVANCFCPPDVECVCGGGAPTMCVPK